MVAAVEAASMLFVALTSSQDKKAKVSALVARNASRKISHAAEKALQEQWREASEEALEFLSLVVKNNPTTPAEKILARPDVQAVMREPYLKAASQSKELLQDYWDKSVKDTESKIKGELKLLGSAWAGYDPDDSLLKSLKADLDRNAKAMRTRLTQVLSGDRQKAAEAIEKAVRVPVLRARYTASTAVWTASRQVRDSAFAKAGVNKMWQGAFGPNMCSHCRGLHGIVVGPFEEFPHNTGEGLLAVYGGKLYGPPRHPSCECVAVPTSKKKTSKKVALAAHLADT